MRSQPLVFPPLPLPLPLPSSSPSSSFPSSRPAMGLFHPSPPSAHHQPPAGTRSAAAVAAVTAAPPPSRAAAVLASQAIKRDAGGSGAAAASSTASSAGAGSGAMASLAPTAGSSRRTSAAAKDTKRRATHSQIERRRREKINDRLITLRNLVPACNEEIAARQRLEGGGAGADHPANAASPTEGGADEAMSGPGVKRKRKRTRRKVVEELKDKDKDKDAEPELGMHKLDVLTHTIEFIYQLQARIEELETGQRPVKAQRAERDETVDEAMQGDTSSLPPPPAAAAPGGPSTAPPPALPPIEEKHPRGFTPIKLGGNYRRDLGHMRSMSASSETTSEADLPLHHQLPTPAYSHGYGYNVGSGYGYGYAFDSSPSFTTGASSSSSKGAKTPASSGALSSLTSPFMSLSASSPIFLAGTSSGGGGGGGGGKKGSLDTRAVAPSFALPPAALSLYEVAHPHHQHQHHGEVRGQHGSTSSVRDGGSQEEEERQEEEVYEMAIGVQSNGSNAMGRSPVPEPEASSAARLLLAMSASPEDALRPVGGSHSDPRTVGATTAPLSMPRMRRSTTTSFRADQLEMGGGPSSVFFAQQAPSSANGASTAAHTHTHAHYRRWVPGSAPGGSRATTTTATGGATTGRMGSLPSPPLLALDDQAGQE